MKRWLTLSLIFILSFSLVFALPTKVLAEKKTKQASSGQAKDPATPKPSSTLKPITTEGQSLIFGSVLDPSVNQVLLLLPKSLLNTIRKLGNTKFSINVISSLDSTKTYSVSTNSISIQRRKVKGVIGKYLVANITNLTNPSGITVSPSSLPTGDYRLRLQAPQLDLTTDSFNYQTPILIVGKVKSDSTGFITVEDFDGNLLSDKIVAISLNGVFLTEVRANKIKLNTLTRKYQKGKDKDSDEDDAKNNNVDNDENTTEGITKTIDTGLVHAVTNKDLFAIVPLNNDTENNAAKVNKPVEVTESSTLAANLGRGYKTLADEIAKDELEKLESKEEEPTETFEDFGCDINQFAYECDLNDDEILASIGADFRDFLENGDCTFPEFGLIKSIILQAPKDANTFIGRGYCENALSSSEEDDQKPCLEYLEVLADFKSGLIKWLPCPPDFCNEFRNIKPPKCVIPVDFCSGTETVSSISSPPQTCRGQECKPSPSQCIIRPVKDVYCARIGTDITDSECYGYTDKNGFAVKWTISQSSHGNQYCVPDASTELVQNKTSEQIAEECEISSCHKGCEEQFKSQLQTPQDYNPGDGTCKICDCHLACDAESGRVVDCNPKSKYFSIKCCNNSGTSGPVIFTGQSNFAGQNFGPSRGPILQDLKGCLCSNPANFNNVNGFVDPEAINICKEKCPRGFEKDPNSESCLPICPEGALRDPNGFCRKKCPEGAIQDGLGNCICPEGQIFGRGGKCETVTCPEYCKNIPLSSTSIPPECKKCIGEGPGICSSGQRRDPATGSCIPITCGPNQYSDSTGICRCSDGSVATSLGPEGCGGTQQCPSPYVTNPSGTPPCKCPDDRPITYGGNCVSICPEGLIADYPQYSSNSPSISMRSCLCPDKTFPAGPNQNQCSSTNHCSPGIPVGTNGCTCNPSGGAYNVGGYCTCPANSGSYTKETGCVSTTAPNCPAPYVTNPAYNSSNPSGVAPCKCPDATPIFYNTTCVASCPSPLVQGIPSGSSGMPSCLCPGTLQPPSANGQCQTTSHTCAVSEVNTSTNPCTCASGATLNSANICTCPSGQTYSTSGCPTADITPPIISLVSASNITSNSATITWITNEASDSQVEYGTTTPYNSQTVTDPSLVTTHSVALSNLSAGTTYHYRIKSKDAYNNLATSIDYTFTTSQSAQITLNSVGINNSNTVSFNFTSTDWTKSTKLKTSDNIDLHGSFISFGMSSGTEFPLPYFNSNLRVGANVKLCYVANESICSQAVTVTETNIRTCNSGETSTSTNLCKCTLGGQPNEYANYTCSCGNGRTYSSTTGCTSHICASGEAFVFSSYSPSNNDCACASGARFDLQNKCACPTGQTYSTTGCTTSDQVTLNSVSINGADVTVSYSKNFDTCVSLLNTSNNILHTQNLFCTNGTNSITIPRSSFNYNFDVGREVKLCYGNNYNTCSQTVIITGTPECVPGQASTSTRPCVCASPATPNGRYGTCLCPAGYIYSNSNYVNSCKRLCSIGETYNSSNPCSCNEFGSFGSNGCTCSNGNTYDPLTGCRRRCNSDEISQGYDACNCAPGAVYDLQNKCTCTSPDQMYTSTGCVTRQSETITLNSVSISGDTVSINFSATSLGGSSCAKLKDSNNVEVQPQVALCFNNGPISYSKSTYFISSFQAGTQVKLCNTSTGVCSSLVTVTSN